MNTEQHESYKNKYKDFDNKYVHDVPLDQILVSHVAGQVRTNGKHSKHLAELKEQIAKEGQSTPITVVPLGTHPPTYDLIAGEHRYDAKHILRDESDSEEHQTIKAAWGFEEVAFTSREEKVLFQLNENTLPASLPCDEADYVQTMVGLIREDYIFGEKMGEVTPEQIRKYLTKNIKHMTSYKAGKISKKVMKGIPSGQRKFRNYATKQEAAQCFSAINPWGLSVNKSGETDKGHIIYFADSLVAIQQNNVHGAFNLKRQHPDKKVLLVVYCGNVLSKTQDIKKWRRDAIVKYKDENGAWFLQDDFKFFDGIVFLPQVLLGKDKEDTNKIINPLGFKV
jgi:hypothetical protein